MRSTWVNVTEASPVQLVPSGGTTIPRRVALYNRDAAISLRVGGPDVSASNGFEVKPSTKFEIDLYGGEVLYGIAHSAGTISIEVLYTEKF